MFKFVLTIILIGIILCLPIKILVVVENCHQCLRVYGSKIAFVPHLNSRIAGNLDMWTPQKSRNMSNGYRLQIFPGRLFPPQLVFPYGNVTVILERYLMSTDGNQWSQVKKRLDYISNYFSPWKASVVLLHPENMQNPPADFPYKISRKYNERPEEFIDKVHGQWLQLPKVQDVLQVRKKILKMCENRQRWRLQRLLDTVERGSQRAKNILKDIQLQVQESCQDTGHSVIFVFGVIAILSFIVWNYYKDPQMYRGYQSPI